MRPTCTHCALKHLSQASILLSESYQGYPTHFFYALGHMAEAGDELVKEYPKYAELVRAERKKLEEDEEYSPDFEGLLTTIDEECSVCQLDPDPPKRGTGRLLGTAKAPTGASSRLSEAERRVRHSCREKILSCVEQLKGDPRVKSPYAVCTAAIKCAPNTILKRRRWASIEWNLVRIGEAAGKYVYIVRARALNVETGKYYPWKDRMTTSSLKEAREFYDKESYTKRKGSEI